MTKKIVIYQTLFAGTVGSINLPDGVKFDDIKDHYVKWDTFHYTIDDENWEEIEIDSDIQGVTDWKRPSGYSITNEDGDHLYDE